MEAIIDHPLPLASYKVGDYCGCWPSLPTHHPGTDAILLIELCDHFPKDSLQVLSAIFLLLHLPASVLGIDF
jgi:hypothetical protein